jgi:alkylation response protein AidB-like acyl-CoA dehydrogenase
MLMWMKSHVEGMRALVYFIGYCFDMSRTEASEEGKGEWSGLMELLTPLCKAFCSDIGFDVCNRAMQVYGGYGYCTEYPIEQFMRDERI